MQWQRRSNPPLGGELEITTLNVMYLEENLLDCDIMGRGFSWLDTGTKDSLMQAANFIQMLQNLQGIIVSSPEEIAYRYHMISKKQRYCQELCANLVCRLWVNEVSRQ